MLEIIDQFGGKNDVLFIGMFIISFFLLSSLIIKNKWRLIFSLFVSSFTSLQLISLFSTQSFVGYQFYIHFNLRGITGVSGLFIPHLIGIFFVFLILVVLNYCSYSFTKKINQFTRRVSVMLICSFFIVTIFVKGSFINDTKSLLTIFQTSNTDFKEVLHNNKMFDYVSPNQIKCAAGKNIILISLESLERAFLSEKHSSLTPNLNKLKNNWNYFDLEQNAGSGWTSGSLYTYLTGFPAFFGIHRNSIFQTAYNSEISSISHVLEKANYVTTYLNGNTDYSGIKEMLSAFHFNKIIDVRNTKKNGHESLYGIRDKDLFEFAKNEIEDLQNSNKPFALFISTTDTHFPNGIYDNRMESVISKKNSELEFMVAAVDYMVGDFITYLESKNLLENTVIYIFPDHLKMGDPSIFENTGKRGLYLITNSDNANILENKLKIIYQIDLPKIILQGAEIQHNLRFLTDYISGDKNEYIKNNIHSITEINTSGLHRVGSKPFHLGSISQTYLKYKRDTSRFIAHAGGKIDGITYTNSKEALDLNYQRGFRYFELDIIQTKDSEFVAAHDWKNWSIATNYYGQLPSSHDQFINYKIYGKYTPLDMAGINDWFSNHKDAILITDKINDPVKFSEKFIDKERLMMELFDINSVKAGIKAGILSAMPSQCVVDKITIDEIKSIAELGVKDIAISRTFIEKNKKLLLEFKSNNIKAYAYHINFAPGINEEYVTKYEMDYIFGIYSDKWPFK